MIRHFKKYFAIRGYVKRLSQDLARRFDRRPFYTIEHVTKAVQRSGFSAVFINYAHAIFCKEEDFIAFYKPLGVSGSYQDLRKTVARRYLSGSLDFDAETIIRKFRPDTGSNDFHESGMADGG
jgi:hypothetical protein